jgi:hypothetical protein
VVPFKANVSEMGTKLASSPLMKTDADVLSDADVLTNVSVDAAVMYVYAAAFSHTGIEVVVTDG